MEKIKTNDLLEITTYLTKEDLDRLTESAIKLKRKVKKYKTDFEYSETKFIANGSREKLNTNACYKELTKQEKLILNALATFPNTEVFMERVEKSGIDLETITSIVKYITTISKVNENALPVAERLKKIHYKKKLQEYSRKLNETFDKCYGPIDPEIIINRIIIITNSEPELILPEFSSKLRARKKNITNDEAKHFSKLKRI